MKWEEERNLERVKQHAYSVTKSVFYVFIFFCIKLYTAIYLFLYLVLWSSPSNQRSVDCENRAFKRYGPQLFKPLTVILVFSTSLLGDQEQL